MLQRGDVFARRRHQRLIAFDFQIGLQRIGGDGGHGVEQGETVSIRQRMLFIDGAAGAAKVVEQLAQRDAAGGAVVEAAGGVGLMRTSAGAL